MTELHQKAINELIAIHKDNPDTIALIINGSVATGKARPDSDVDLCLVVSDEKFEQIKKTKSYFYGTWDPDDFFGIEIDGKYINMDFLRKAAEQGNEPVRNSFTAAYTAFSHSDEVEKLIKKIPVYPEAEREKRIKAFYAYVIHYRYTGEDAFNQQNLFLSRNCAIELVFFASRLVLAHNRILYPCRKSLFKALEKCPLMPPNFIELSLELLENSSAGLLISYFKTVTEYFKEYAYPDTERIGLILENEWTWYTGKLTISEW